MQSLLEVYYFNILPINLMFNIVCWTILKLNYFWYVYYTSCLVHFTNNVEWVLVGVVGIWHLSSKSLVFMQPQSTKVFACKLSSVVENLSDELQLVWKTSMKTWKLTCCYFKNRFPPIKERRVVGISNNKLIWFI